MTTAEFRLSAPPPDIVVPVAVPVALSTGDSGFTLSAPPPDIVVPVAVPVALSNGDSGFTLSAPPPDIVVPVAVPVALSTGDGGFTLSAPPPDIVVPVEVPLATTVAVASALADDLPDAWHEADHSDDADAPLVAVAEQAAPVLLPFTNDEAFRIVTAVAAGWSGKAGWSAVHARTDSVPPATPFGLCFGLLLFAQSTGRLGEVVRLYRDRDPQDCAQTLGPDLDALLATLTAPSPALRLVPVGGVPVWSEAWRDRFAAAGASPACQYAQNEVAIERVLRPVVPLLAGLGLTTDRGLAMGLDRVVAAGVGTGLASVVAAVSPFRTDAHRVAALRSLGDADVSALQQRVGLPVTGTWTARSCAALVAEADARGVLPAPEPAEAQQRLVRAVTGPARRRLEALASTPSLDDRSLDLSRP